MKKKKCYLCGKPATRTTVLYTSQNNNVSKWINFKRKYFPNTTAMKTSVCDECFFELHYGLHTMKCKKCNKEFKIDGFDFYNVNKINCPYCKGVIRV